MKGHASPAQGGFRLPMGRSCPPLREGRSRGPVRPPPCLGSCGRGAPAEHPARPDRRGARARARARRELRARAGARAPRTGRRGRRARVAGRRRAPRPAAFAGIDAAVALVLSHVRAGTRVTVHGDYDVDGVCSTAILVRALRTLGAEVGLVPAQPHRGRLRARRGDRRAPGRARHARCCSPPTARSPRSTRSRWRAPPGMDVVVTDHHSPRADGSLPDAPIVHPSVVRLPVSRPVRRRRRLQVRRRAAGRRRRAIPRAPTRTSTSSRSPPSPTASRCAARTAGSCARACTRCATSRKPGLRALLRVAKVDPGALDARAIGFRLAPRINAAGRLYRADAGLELVLTDDAERAAAIADELDHANAERRHAETRILFEAEAQVRDARRAARLRARRRGLAPGGHRHRRLADRRAPPPPVRDDRARRRPRGPARGARSPPSTFSPALDASAEHLLRHGGHRAAAAARSRASTSTPSAPPSSRTPRRSCAGGPRAHRARRRGRRGRRARPRARRGARAAGALRDRQPVGLAARSGRAARRLAADGRGGPPRALHRRGRRPPRARGRLRRQPAARRRRAHRRDVHPGAQRVERRGRAAARPAPRPGARARGRHPGRRARGSGGRRPGRAGGAAAGGGRDLARGRRPARPARRRARRHAGGARGLGRARARRLRRRAPPPRAPRRAGSAASPSPRGTRSSATPR